jgi:hypothetical protein
MMLIQLSVMDVISGAFGESCSGKLFGFCRHGPLLAPQLPGVSQCTILLIDDFLLVYLLK